jgi:hypothetical protein
MVVRLALWSLVDTNTTVAELRAESFARTRGAVFETWFSDEATERWGSFAVFADADAAAQPPPERLRELVAKEPDVVEVFELESQP